MRNQKKLDWEKIEPAYRAGQISIREIARRHGCSDKAIRMKAKKKGWQRDLTKRIQEEVRSSLVRTKVRTLEETQATDKEIIETAVGVGIAIEQLQRKDIGKLRELEAKLLDELDNEPLKLYITQFKGMIVQKEIRIAVTEKASALNHLSQVMQRRIKLEREAYNLDTSTENEKPDWTKVAVDPRVQDMFDNPDLYTPPVTDETMV